MAAYASGTHIDAAPSVVDRARRAGFEIFKIKVGFDAKADSGKVVALAATLAEGERLLADANQAWDLAGAQEFLARSAEARLGWMEEPLAADAPAADWQALAGGPVPLAGGENIAGEAEFDAALALGALGVVQPDVAKWGGVTGCLAVALKALAAGRIYCPHFLGGGLGLIASAHVLAAAGGPGLLEVDVNSNPLRDALADVTEAVSHGLWSLSDVPGLRIEALPGAVLDRVTHRRPATCN